MSVSTKKSRMLFIFKNIVLLSAFAIVASININSKSPQDKVNPHSKLTKKIKHTQKLGLPFFTKITSTNKKIEKNEVFELTGSVHSTQELRNLSLKWLVSENFTVEQGSLKIFVSSLKVGEEKTFQIKLKALSDENEIIHFFAETKNGKSIFSNSTQFHTIIGDEIKDANKKLSERNLKFAAKKK